MNHSYTFLALDIARRRSDEAARLRVARTATPDPGSGAVRRGLAAGLALVARGSTAAVRRLDDCTADDLARSLAAR